MFPIMLCCRQGMPCLYGGVATVAATITEKSQNNTISLVKIWPDGGASNDVVFRRDKVWPPSRQ